MSIYKRGEKYWFKFMWNGQVIRRSTKVSNYRDARNIESAFRTKLANGEVGIKEKRVAPTLKQFATSEFLPWAKATFTAKIKTWQYYRNGVLRLVEFLPLAERKLDEITGEQIAAYIARRRAARLQVSSINRELQVLRRMLKLAAEWGKVERASNVKMLPGERRRELVVTPHEEAVYFEAAPELLASVAGILIDTGLRTEECHRLRWEDINWTAGQNGLLLVTHGKTKAARRMIPMRDQVRGILETLWERADRPAEGWVWPAPTRSGHIEPSSLRKQHARAFRIANEKARQNGKTPIRRFLLYDLRHTFLTRLGESGCDVWTHARIAGHSSIAMSVRYVHPSEDAVLRAMSRLSGHNSGHRAEQHQLKPAEQKLLNDVNEGT